jgi:aminoglycoside phosphotransferase (APT) family kinase protein
MTAASAVAPLPCDDMDPYLEAMLDAKPARASQGDYHPLSTEQIEGALLRLLAAKGHGGSRLGNIRRLSGGAAREQFAFDLLGPDGHAEALVLRMDPCEGVLDTLRVRELEVINAVQGLVPAPAILFEDLEGEYLGAPGLVTSFVDGVTKPRDALSGVSGLGTGFTPEWRARLAPQFIDNLAAIHAIDYRNSGLDHFGMPLADPYQPARWMVNFWSRAWRDDSLDGSPVTALAEMWLRDNLPACSDPVLVHGDYRTGNYLFDADTGRVTAVLDWELAQIGDFHLDLALNLIEIFGRRGEDGTTLCSSLMSRDEMIARYEAASGRTVNRATLRFYHILCAWSLTIMGRATGLRAAQARHNHQDILLTWLSMVAHPLNDEILRLLIEETKL